eukprot:11634147-Heterocapsa_arctica.AAC.1
MRSHYERKVDFRKYNMGRGPECSSSHGLVCICLSGKLRALLFFRGKRPAPSIYSAPRKAKTAQ